MDNLEMDLDKKLIDDVFHLFDSTKINQMNSFKEELNLEILEKQINDLFNELHEFVIFLCNKQQELNDDNQFKKNKRFKASTDLAPYLTACEVLSDHLYEQMNKGKWFKISIEMRLSYGLIILYYVLIRLYESSLIKFGKDESSDFKDTVFELLNKIDNGLIYSPPFLNNSLAKCAALLHAYLIIRQPIQDDYTQIYKDKHSNSRTNHAIEKSKEIKRVKLIDLDDFYENYFRKKIPCIIEAAIDDWPAVHKWDLNYLLNKSAYRLIPVEIGNRYTDENWTQQIMTLKDFVDKFIINQDGKGYCAQYELFERLEELSDDFYTPDYCALSDCETDLEADDGEDVHINAWFGPNSTISPLHNDPKDNLLAQVFGSKYVRLYSAKVPVDNLYVYSSNLLNNTSQVDIDNIDFDKYPKFPIEYEEAILNKGELLYIPKKHWHYVRSTDLSFSISFWWK